MPRLINAAGQKIIKDSESLVLTSYLCPAGKLTIGWGHTGPDVVPYMTITAEQAERLFESDLGWAEDCVERYCTVRPTDNQYAAMVSLCFNIGPDPTKGFPSSSVLRLHNAGKPEQAAQSFALWNKAMVGGQLTVMPGLVIRRAHEAALYMTPDVVAAPQAPQPASPAPVPVPEKPPVPQAVEPPKSLTTSKSVVTGVVGTVAAAGAVVDQVTPAIDAISNATDAAKGAATAVGGLKAAFGSFISGNALPVVLTVLAVGCIAFVVWRYVIKARRGEVVST